MAKSTQAIDKPEPLNFHEHLPRFLQYVTGLNELTRATYSTALRAFFNSGKAITHSCLCEFDEWLGKAKYERAGAKRAYSPETRALYVNALRKYMVWLEVEGMIPANSVFNATERLKLYTSRSRRTSRISREAPDDTDTIIRYFDDQPEPTGRDADRMRLEQLRNRALLHALWDSAGRISEVLQITREMIEDGNKDTVPVIGKGSKRRLLMFTPETLARVKAYCAARQDAYPALFISHRRDKGAQLSRIAAWGIVKRAARGVGIKGMISPHIIRHARANQLINEGMPIEAIQLFLGHESIATTQAYYAHLKMERVKEQLEIYSQQPRRITTHD